MVQLATMWKLLYYKHPQGSSAESGAHACVLRHLCRCSRCSQRSVSRFPVNRQSFRTYHVPQVTGILPALSGTLFWVLRCVAYIVLLCFGGRSLVSFCVCYVCRSCGFSEKTLCGVYLCVLGELLGPGAVGRRVSDNWVILLLTVLRLGFELFFLVPRTYNSANRTIPIYTNHLKVRVWAIFFSATYLQFRQYRYSHLY